MGHVVPNWDLDDSSVPARFDLRRQHSVATVPMLGYEMAELTWENGQLTMHELGPGPRATVETLEAIVDQATQKKQLPPPGNGGIDALVPCGTHNEEGQQGDDDQAVHVPPLDTTAQRGTTSIAGSPVMKKPRITSPRVPAEKEESFQQSQQSGSVARSRDDSRHVFTVDTSQKDSTWVGFETASLSSQGRTLSSSDNPASTNNTNTISSACLTRQQDEESNEEDKKGSARSSLSTKRSRAAATHSQSERKRRETINQKIKTLQKMVPNSNKTDKASMLDEVIDHVKTLQARHQMMMMSRMSMPSMMMPFAMPQHQLRMPMMPHMGMGMGMRMDMNIMNPMMACQNLAGLSPVINPTAAFMPPMAPWDVTTGTDRSPSVPTMAPLDPSSYLAPFQPQPMTMEAYSKMVALMKQQQQQLASISKT